MRDHLTCVDCNDNGAVFTEARVAGDMSSLALSQQTTEGFLQQLLPLSHQRELLPDDDQLSSQVILAVQINYFDCGGIAFGVCIWHETADASTLASFAKIWAEIARREENVDHDHLVVIVGFGSECKLSKDQVYEIAYMLELSLLPFLWAIRKPNWAAEETETLPPGFADRTKNRGIVCIGWAPQLEILDHRSIGGSLFHAGWGSMIETLQYGHCLILLPFIIDQPLNARLLVEKGLAVEVDRGEDGSFSRNDIAKSLRLAMVSDEGEEQRARAKSLAVAIFGNEKLHQD